MTLVVEELEGVVRFSGQMDLSTIRSLTEILSARRPPVLLDLANVDRLDSAALLVLLRAHDRRRDDGEVFRLIAASSVVRRVIEAAGVAPKLLP